MDICVCGAQVPFMRGGAELLTENLATALREAGHRAEVVRLPTAWDNARIFDAALAWRLVPIDADLVIATNFPSYFVRHPHKVVWLLHQHRAAYDGAGTPWSDFDLRVEALEAQRLLAECDERALAEAKVLYAASRVVADRLAHFNGRSIEPLYHPAPLHDELLALDLADGWKPSLQWWHDHAGSLEQGPYNFSKEIVERWTMQRARPLIRRGIRINSVCPGPIDTPLLADFRATTSDKINDWMIREMAGRPVAAREVASTLAFLASPGASYLTGLNIDVDGGFGAAVATKQVDYSGRT